MPKMCVAYWFGLIESCSCNIHQSCLCYLSKKYLIFSVYESHNYLSLPFTFYDNCLLFSSSNALMLGSFFLYLVNLIGRSKFYGNDSQGYKFDFLDVVFPGYLFSIICWSTTILFSGGVPQTCMQNPPL